MNLDIVYAHRGDIADAHPVGALIKRGKHSKMRARVKQFRVYRIFTHNLDGSTGWKVAGYRLPRLAQIGRTPDGGTIITRAISAGSDIRHVCVQVGGLDTRHPLAMLRLR